MLHRIEMLQILSANAGSVQPLCCRLMQYQCTNSTRSDAEQYVQYKQYADNPMQHIGKHALLKDAARRADKSKSHTVHGCRLGEG